MGRDISSDKPSDAVSETVKKNIVSLNVYYVLLSTTYLFIIRSSTSFSKCNLASYIHLQEIKS
jgi:uncharacterized membrane protein (GlpM family)